MLLFVYPISEIMKASHHIWLFPLVLRSIEKTSCFPDKCYLDWVIFPILHMPTSFFQMQYYFFLEFVTKKRYIKKKVILCVTVQQIKALMDKPNCRCLVINPYGGNKNVIPTPARCTLTSTGKDTSRINKQKEIKI